MKIELNWEDVEIYAVAFYVKKLDGTSMLLHRNLVFKVGVNEKKIMELIKTKFSNVSKIHYIDLIDESALKLK